jgi:hypothetical protein
MASAFLFSKRNPDVVSKIKKPVNNLFSREKYFIPALRMEED